jgi:hypothetical protein
MVAVQGAHDADTCERGRAAEVDDQHQRLERLIKKLELDKEILADQDEADSNVFK